jgi:general secretion pathway protein D
LQILPLSSLNSLLVITQSVEWIPDIKVWIDRFDESPRTEEGELFVLALRHAKAESVHPLLTQVLRLQGGNSAPRPAPTLSSATMTPGRSFGQSQFSSFSAAGLPASTLGQTPVGAATAPSINPLTPTTSANPQGSGGPLSPGASISLDIDNNALLIFGTQRDYALIESAVEKLDQMPRQVLIEATILDLTLTGQFEFGLSGFLQEHYNPADVKLDDKVTGIFSRDIRFDRAASDAAFTFTGVFANRYGLLKAILTAKDSRTNANVISQPRVWALDNRPARLLVQDQIPIPVNTFIPGVGTGTGSSGYNVTNVQYLDTGLNLTVTPHINGSGVIRLEIQQEISSSTGTETLGSGTSAVQAPRISRRTLSTELIAQDGATIVLGGLIRQTKSEVSVGFPILNRIPLIRHLFSSRRTVNEKSELVILLTPKVVSTSEDVDRVARELKARVTRAIGKTWFEKLNPVTPNSPSLPQ